MFTRCHNCETVFRVGTGQLHQAHGQVRCGRCGQVFNALATLSEAFPPPVFDPAAAAFSDAPTRTPAGEDEAIASLADSEKERSAAEPSFAAEAVSEFLTDFDTSGRDRPTDRDTASPPASPASSTNGVSAAAEEEFNEIFAASEAFPDPAGREQAPATAGDDEDDGGNDVSTVENGSNAVHDVDDGTEPGKGKPPWLETMPILGLRPERHARWWLAGSSVLLLLLTVQLVNLNRQTLAWYAGVGPAVRAVYAVLGRSVVPRRDPAMLRVSRAEVAAPAAAAGALDVEATLENTASFPQPWPLLRIRLTNRWGETVAARAFRPREYLAAADVERQLGPGGRAVIKLRLADPGAEAVGFELQPCYTVNKRLACRNGHRGG